MNKIGITTVPKMNGAEMELAREMENIILKENQISIETVHTLHGGIYARTIELKKGNSYLWGKDKCSYDIIHIWRNVFICW